jgi:hypothetical protein
MAQHEPWLSNEWWPKTYGNCSVKGCPCSAGDNVERGALKLFRYQFALCTTNEEKQSLLQAFESRWGHRRVHIPWCSHGAGGPCQCKEVYKIKEVAEHYRAWDVHSQFGKIWSAFQSRGLPGDILKIIQRFWSQGPKPPASDCAVCGSDCPQCVIHYNRKNLAKTITRAAKAERVEKERAMHTETQAKIQGQNLNVSEDV